MTRRRSRHAGPNPIGGVARDGNGVRRASPDGVIMTVARTGTEGSSSRLDTGLVLDSRRVTGSWERVAPAAHRPRHARCRARLRGTGGQAVGRLIARVTSAALR